MRNLAGSAAVIGLLTTTAGFGWNGFGVDLVLPQSAVFPGNPTIRTASNPRGFDDDNGNNGQP